LIDLPELSLFAKSVVLSTQRNVVPDANSDSSAMIDAIYEALDRDERGEEIGISVDTIESFIAIGSFGLGNAGNY
jgi:hypothetical protein